MARRVRGVQQGRSMYRDVVKDCVDEAVLDCLGDCAIVNGEPVWGTFDTVSYEQGGGLQKVVHTTSDTFCFPTCKFPRVTCQMPVEFDGQLYSIKHIRPARWNGWTCLTLSCCPIKEQPKEQPLQQPAGLFGAQRR